MRSFRSLYCRFFLFYTSAGSLTLKFRLIQNIAKSTWHSDCRIELLGTVTVGQWWWLWHGVRVKSQGPLVAVRVQLRLRDKCAERRDRRVRVLEDSGENRPTGPINAQEKYPAFCRSLKQRRKRVSFLPTTKYEITDGEDPVSKLYLPNHKDEPSAISLPCIKNCKLVPASR